MVLLVRSNVTRAMGSRFDQTKGKYVVSPRVKAGAINTSKAIIIAIDQYAEAATGNREFFLNKPPVARRADMP